MEKTKEKEGGKDYVERVHADMLLGVCWDEGEGVVLRGVVKL